MTRSTFYEAGNDSPRLVRSTHRRTNAGSGDTNFGAHEFFVYISSTRCYGDARIGALQRLQKNH